MIDQYFGVKELYEVALKAKVPMYFGSRYIEAGEPVLYFENVTMSVLNEKNQPVFARGGWNNLPRVIWEDRSEVQFALSEGVMSAVSMSILLSAKVAEKGVAEPLLVPKREGPMQLQVGHKIYPQYWPASTLDNKTFIFEYARDVAQRKVYGKEIHGVPDPFTGEGEIPCIEVYNDKELTQLASMDNEYLIDYYYQYNDEALIYTIQKERFNGLFTLEGKFYSKDENEGLNYTNIIYMPKVRVVSDINLRLGERADPTMSVFNIIGMPETTTDKKSLILEITRLSEDIE